MRKSSGKKTIKTHSGKTIAVDGVVLHKKIEITALYSALHYQYSQNFQFGGESHDFWELVYVNNGIVIVEEKDKSYSLKQSQFFLHAPGEFHKIRTDAANTDVIIVSFDSSSPYLYAFTEKVHVSNNIQKVLVLEILNAAKKAMRNYKGNTSNAVYEQITRNTLELFFLYVNYYGIYGMASKKTGKYSNTLVQTITEYLEKNIANKVTFDDLKQLTHYSESNIGKLFKKYTGLSVFQYYNKLKLAKARELLSQNNYSISEISEILGFDTVQYFTYFIKKHLKMSPSEYRISAIKTNLVNPNENDILLID